MFFFCSNGGKRLVGLSGASPLKRKKENSKMWREVVIVYDSIIIMTNMFQFDVLVALPP